MSLEPDSVTFREACRDDLESIIDLLSDDPLGETRESTELYLAQYATAFEEIQRDLSNSIIVGVNADHGVIAVLQLTLIPNLSRGGMKRAQIEGVRVAAHARGSGLGERLIRHAIDFAQSNACGLVQLTTDRQRPDAVRFYERLGFKNTHHGMKLLLP